MATLDVHDLRIARRSPRDLEKRFTVEPEPFGENETLRKSQPIEPENEVYGELGATAVTRIADVEIDGEQRAQSRLGLGDDLGITADEAHAFTTLHLPARTRYRSLEKAKAPRAYPLSKRSNTVGVAGAGAQHDAA